MTYSNTSGDANGGSAADRLNQAQQTAEKAVNDIRHKAEDVLGGQSFDVSRQVQDHPWLALGVVAAAGYLLSRVGSGDQDSYQRGQSQQPWQGYQGQQPWQGGQQPWQGYQGQQGFQGPQRHAGAMEQLKQYESGEREGMVGKLGRRMFGSVGTLEELYQEKLQDLYDAEHQILKALPMMIEAASSHELKRAFDAHMRQTQTHVGRLQQVFQRLNMQPRGKPCTAMRGILAEGEEIMAMRAEPEVKDAALVSAAQHVEHHEIVSYGTLRTWARQLGHHDAAQLLQQTLTEEEQTDRQLTQIAERSINVRATR